MGSGKLFVGDVPMNFLISSFFSVLTYWGVCSGFVGNIEQMCNYVRDLPEAVTPSGTENWLDPDFESSYHQFFLNPVWRRLSLGFGVDTSPLKKEQLRTSITEYIRPDYQRTVKQDEASFVLLDVQPEDKFFVVGDLHGAIHSLVRLFIQWHQAGKLSSNLEVLDPKLRIVFLGDYLNRSPYGFFLLPLLIAFANKNPQQVFLLRGRQESYGYWEQFLASRQFLTQLVGQYSNIRFQKELPLSLELNNFFGQLYDGVICTHKGTGEQIVIAHNKIPNQITPSPSTIALVRGENRTRRTIVDRGLLLDQFFQGTASWNVFSAPVVVYSRIGLLVNDSYAILPVEHSFAVSSIFGVESEPFELQSGINLLTHPIEQKRWRFSLAYGHQLQTKESINLLNQSKPYFVCSSVDLSGGLQGMGIGIKEGMEACFLWANFKREVPGIYFRPVVLDDGYDPELMKKNTDLFMRLFGADNMLLAMGSPTVSGILPLCKSGQIVLFFPATGSPYFRSPQLPNMIHFRHTNTEEVEPLVEHVKKFYGANKFALVYQDDAFGRPLLESAEAYLAKHYPESKIVSIPVLHAQKPVKKNIEKLRRFNPDSIGFFISSQVQLNGLADQLGIDFLLGKKLFSVGSSTDVFYEFAERWGLKIIHMSSFQLPEGRHGAFMETYRNVMRMYRYPLSRSSVEGFTGAWLYVAGMKKSYPDISAHSILKHLVALNPGSLFGHQLKFENQTNSFTGPLWMNDGEVIYRVEPKAAGGYDFVSVAT